MIVIAKDLLSLNQDIAGQEIGIPVYRLYDDNNPKDVPLIYIQSAVHAAEMQGSAVIYRLMEALKQLKVNAEFLLVPNCNPFGRTQRAGEYLQGRFDATTGNNWNRFYHYSKQQVEDFVEGLPPAQLSDTTESGQAKLVSLFKQHWQQMLSDKLHSKWGINTAQFLNTTLQTMAVNADIVLDLHTGPSSTRHIYSPDYLAESARLFNIENIISIPTSFAGALDEASFTPWCYLRELLSKRGYSLDFEMRAFTIELGSQENICLVQAEYDAEGILNYLQEQGLVDGFDGVDEKDITTTPLSQYRTLFSQHAGMVEYIARAGDKVVKGQTIARVLNSLEFDNEKAVLDIVSPATGTVILHYPSAAVQVGTQLYKIAVDE